MKEKPKKNQLTFTADPDIEERLRAEADRLDRSLAWIINYYLHKGFESTESISKTSSKQ
jgi:predicted transcriptional regulator